MKKILMVASSGGHLEEALALKPLKEKYQTVLVTEKTDYKVNYWQDTMYLMPQVNRKRIQKLDHVFSQFFQNVMDYFERET